MEFDVGLEFFTDLGQQVKNIGETLDRQSRCKPIHYAVAGIGGTVGNNLQEVDLQVDDYPPYGRVWNLRSVAVQLNPVLGSQALTNAGSVTSPGAGAQIVQTPALSAGVYNVTVTTMLGGTVSATDANNMQISLGQPQPVLPVSTIVGQVDTYTYQATVSSLTNHIAVKAIAAGTVGAIYYATISAVPAAGSISADVYCGQNQLTPDISSQIIFNENFTVPGIYYFPEKAIWSHRGDTIFARVYNVAATTQVSLVAQITEYPLEAVEALSV